MNKSLLRALQGMALSIAAPLGWFAIRVLDGADPVFEMLWHPGVYLYMLFGTAAAFGGFGWFVGRHEEHYRDSSLHDPLTGVFNVRHFWEQLEEERAIAQRHQRPLSLIIGDIDRFKRVNDAYGHRVGDDVLVEITRSLASVRRRGDTVARIGGEEFAVILPDTGIEEAVAVAQRLRELVGALEFRSGKASPSHFGVTISFGVALLRRGAAATVDELYRDADRALYQAKDAGRNRVVAAESSPLPVIVPMTLSAASTVARGSPS